MSGAIVQAWNSKWHFVRLLCNGIDFMCGLRREVGREGREDQPTYLPHGKPEFQMWTDLRWEKTRPASGVFDCRLLLCLGPVYVWKLGFINVEEFGVTCAAVLRVTLCWCSTPTRVLNLYCLDISCRLRAGLIILSYLPWKILFCSWEAVIILIFLHISKSHYTK